MIHLLDTSVCIAAMRGNVHVQQQLLNSTPSDCGVSSAAFDHDTALHAARIRWHLDWTGLEG